MGPALICFWIDTTPDNNESTTTNTQTEGYRFCVTDGEPVDETEANDEADRVEKTWLGPASVDAEPETSFNEIGDSHTITAYVYDDDGALYGDQTSEERTTVFFEFFAGSPGDPKSDGTTPETPDAQCETGDASTQPGMSDDATCSYTYTSNTSGTDRVCVWVNDRPATTGDSTNGTCDDEGLSDSDDAPNEPDAPSPRNDDQDLVTKTWRPAQQPTTATRLDCEPENDVNPTNTNHTVTCTARNDVGQTIAAAGIDVEATGANDPDNSDSRTTPDFSCITGSNGICTFTHGPQTGTSTREPGTTTYRAWIDKDGQNSTVEADNTEGRDEQTQPGAQEPDGTDVVTKEWEPTPTKLTISPEADSAVVGECNPFTITITDANGGVSNATIDVEQRHQTADDTTTDNEPTVSFCTPTSGPNPSGVDTTRGDLGPNSTASDRENPDNPGTAGGETTGTTDSNGQITIGIAITEGQGSDGSGTVRLTAFYDGDQTADGRPEDNDDPDPSDPKATATKTWEQEAAPGGRSIDCEPENSQTDVNEAHTITCFVRDAAGQPAGGVGISWTEEGPGFFVSTQGTTDEQGRATAAVRSDEPGQQSITARISNSQQNEPDTDECDRAVGDPAGAQQGVCSDTVTNTWTEEEEPPGESCPNFDGDSRNQVVGTEGNDTLRGTEGDDVICGLGGDDLIDGLGGNDLIIGGSGNDSLRGGDGNDELKGNSGKDELRGNGGNDVLRGGNQNDDLRGNAGDDVMRGQAGFDVLRGGSGDDEGHGGSGNDTIQGFTGNDLLVGNSGNDTMKGAGGRDEIRGGKNDDVISGGKGPDRIRGGPGSDVCAGGPGNDNIRGCER